MFRINSMTKRFIADCMMFLTYQELPCLLCNYKFIFDKVNRKSLLNQMGTCYAYDTHVASIMPIRTIG